MCNSNTILLELPLPCLYIIQSLSHSTIPFLQVTFLLKSRSSLNNFPFCLGPPARAYGAVQILDLLGTRSVRWGNQGDDPREMADMTKYSSLSLLCRVLLPSIIANSHLLSSNHTIIYTCFRYPVNITDPSMRNTWTYIFWKSESNSWSTHSDALKTQVCVLHLKKFLVLSNLWTRKIVILFFIHCIHWLGVCTYYHTACSSLYWETREWKGIVGCDE